MALGREVVGEVAMGVVVGTGEGSAAGRVSVGKVIGMAGSVVTDCSGADAEIDKERVSWIGGAVGPEGDRTGEKFALGGGRSTTMTSCIS